MLILWVPFEAHLLTKLIAYYGLHRSALALAEANVPMDDLLLAAAGNRVDDKARWKGYRAIEEALLASPQTRP